jgi:hypothetical protein
MRLIPVVSGCQGRRNRPYLCLFVRSKMSRHQQKYSINHGAKVVEPGFLVVEVVLEV